MKQRSNSPSTKLKYSLLLNRQFQSIIDKTYIPSINLTKYKPLKSCSGDISLNQSSKEVGKQPYSLSQNNNFYSQNICTFQRLLMYTQMLLFWYLKNWPK